MLALISMELKIGIDLRLKVQLYNQIKLKNCPLINIVKNMIQMLKLEYITFNIYLNFEP